MLSISEVEIVAVKPQNGLVAFASFIINGSIYCGSVGIFTRPNGGYRLVYPTKQVAGRQLDIFHPISAVTGRLIEQEVITKYEEVMNNAWNRHSGINAIPS
ncbi:MAG TPA: septation protein SpoVG family protein [Candidatus Saccharimonadales bacterium]|nr:septation protein SpoVG family protein [Candidatus Saccharimonadales bacterium]